MPMYIASLRPFAESISYLLSTTYVGCMSLRCELPFTEPRYLAFFVYRLSEMFALIVGITTCAVAATYNFLFIEVRELVSEIERIIVFLVFRRGRKFNAHVRAREMKHA
jgi:hypothetical protein